MPETQDMPMAHNMPIVNKMPIANKKRSSLQIQKSVVHALFVREMKTRFGRYKMGYAWALIEPLAHILILAALFSARGKGEISGIPFVMFFLLGISPFLLFSKCMGQAIGTIEGNAGLFLYRQVRPFDTLLTRFLLESVISFVALVALVVLFGWYGLDVSIHNPLLLIATFLTFGLVCFGITLVLGVVGALYPEWAKFVPIISKPLYFISAVMFPLSMIPEQYHHYLLWNPLLHMTELMREAWFYGYEAPGVSLEYLFMFGLSTTTLGMLMYRANWRRLIASR